MVRRLRVHPGHRRALLFDQRFVFRGALEPAAEAVDLPASEERVQPRGNHARGATGHFKAVFVLAEYVPHLDARASRREAHEVVHVPQVFDALQHRHPLRRSLGVIGGERLIEVLPHGDDQRSTAGAPAQEHIVLSGHLMHFGRDPRKDRICETRPRQPMGHADHAKIFSERMAKQGDRLRLELWLRRRIEIERQEEHRSFRKFLDVVIHRLHLGGNLDREPEWSDERQQGCAGYEQENDAPIDADHPSGKRLHWSLLPPRYERSMPRMIFNDSATAPMLTPIRIALRTALFRTFNSHWVTSHVQGARNWPNGTRPIITITAATSRTAASRERARKAR